MSDLATVLLAVVVVTGAAIGHAGTGVDRRRGSGCCAGIASAPATHRVLCAARFGLGGACGGRSRADARATDSRAGSRCSRIRRRLREASRSWPASSIATSSSGRMARRRERSRPAPRWRKSRGHRCDPGRPSAESPARCPPPRGRAARHRRDPRVRASEPSASRWRTGCIARSRQEPACCRGRPKGFTSASSSVTGAASTTRPTGGSKQPGSRTCSPCPVRTSHSSSPLPGRSFDGSGSAGSAVAALVVIGFFATVTRFEPSVLRGERMAGLAAVAEASGRPASGLRLLSLAIAGLVLVDPFLVWSIGFRLSVGASLGILLLARPIADRCPGPAWLAEALGVTTAAQLGVAPVAIPVVRFDPPRCAPREPARRAGRRPVDDVGRDRGLPGESSVSAPRACSTSRPRSRSGGSTTWPVR